MLFLTIPRSQSQSSPTTRPNPMTRKRGRLPYQRMPDVRELLHKPQRKSMGLRRMMKEISLWMENLISSRLLYWKKFILGRSIRFFGVHTGKRRWVYHSIQIHSRCRRCSDTNVGSRNHKQLRHCYSCDT